MKQYILSYVNMPKSTDHVDLSFPTMKALEDYVKLVFPSFTSFQVIVLP